MANKTYGDVGVNYGDSFYGYNGIIQNYTRQTIVGLPINDTDLSVVFSSQDYVDVATKDNIYVTQSN